MYLLKCTFGAADSGTTSGTSDDKFRGQAANFSVSGERQGGTWHGTETIPLDN